MVTLFLIWLGLLCSGPICSVSGASFYRDAQALVDFKNSLPNPTLLPTWVAGEDPCSFSGVRCGESKRVSAVDLAGVTLSVEFKLVASSLMGLEKLETLSLESANLSGVVLLGSGSNCGSSLKELDLAGNGLSGEISDLSSLTACSSLKLLNLSGNFLESPANLKSSGFLKISKLQTLDLSHNKISGAGIVNWVVSGGCEDLEVLSLRGNKVAGDFTVAGCEKLKFLDLAGNNFSTAVSAAAFGGCAAVEHLDISGNKFAGDLGHALSACNSLVFLNASNNRFSGEVPAAIPTGKLQFLSLAHNDFAGNFPRRIIADCANLTRLDLSYNNLSGTVPVGLRSCSLITSLDLSGNRFSGDLPVETLLRIPSLRRVALGYNEFSGELPGSLSEMTGLETLDLSSNSFSGEIPANLCERSSLRELYLQNNMIGGTIPETLSNCSGLVSLDLSFNYLTGTIPRSLGSLGSLRDLIMLLNQLTGEIPDSLGSIGTLENLILDFNFLTGTIPARVGNCSKLNWISLSNNLLSGEIPSWIGNLSNLAILKLSNNSFVGEIPKQLGDCRSLMWLDLNTNRLTGPIPTELFKQSGLIDVNFVSEKMYVYIKNDGSRECHGAGSLLEFVGIRQEQLNRVSTRNPCNFTRVYKGVVGPTFTENGSMIFFDVSHNALTGTIPKEIGTMSYCFILNLGHNNISGSIPEELGSMKSLAILDLSYNRLEGSIPQTFSSLSSIGEADLSNNYLSGMIPQSGQLETLQAAAFVNNSGLCGLPLPACVWDSAGTSSRRVSHQKQASLAGSVAMGLVFSLFCIVGFAIVVIETRKRRRKKMEDTLDAYISNSNNSGNRNGNNSTAWKLTGAREALSINLAAFELPLKKLTFADLLEATNGFHDDSLIGSGGFGDVYKARLKDGSVVAIKKLIHVSGQGDREFTAEMETIGKIKHRNLVPLLGYCKVGEERLLVYEYMKHGSLEDVLHGQAGHPPGYGGPRVGPGPNMRPRLDWPARRKIAVGAARGLAFLHHNCFPHIIHRDMKSSNVLIDGDFEARVSDFGMARLVSPTDTHLSVSTLAGTPGYVPPEYYQSFRCTTKGDVYSYGVVLLELLTGRRPTDSAEFGDNNLVGWVKQHAKLRISDVFDPDLIRDDPTVEIELLQHLKVATACLDDRYWLRPTMIQVMAMFKDIQAGSGFDSSSTIGAGDGGFGGVELVIKEGTELKE